MKITHDRAIGHGLPAISSGTYVVNARIGDPSKTHICYTFIVAAGNARDAIRRVRQNARTVLETVRAESTAEELEPVEWVAEPNLDAQRAVAELRESISTWSAKLDALRESELDMLNLVAVETLTDQIRAAWAKIRELSTPVRTGRESVFEARTSRMREMLRRSTRWEAEPVPDARAVPVAYYDDSRSILHFVQRHI